MMIFLKLLLPPFIFLVGKKVIRLIITKFTGGQVKHVNMDIIRENIFHWGRIVSKMGKV